MPEHLWLQSDNTPAQAKNSECAQYFAMLVRKFKFRTCSLNFLAVGHTHEDIDQLFGAHLTDPSQCLIITRRRFINIWWRGGTPHTTR